MDNHKIAVTESTPAKLARILTQTTNILSSYILVHVQMSCLPFYSIIQNLVTIFNSLLYLTTHEKKILFFFFKKNKISDLQYITIMSAYKIVIFYKLLNVCVYIRIAISSDLVYPISCIVQTRHFGFG